jgi:hypothetical protein
MINLKLSIAHVYYKYRLLYAIIIGDRAAILRLNTTRFVSLGTMFNVYYQGSYCPIKVLIS